MKILHDIHTHNIFSNCCADHTASTSACLQKEAELGMKLFGLSNHVWDERVRGASYWYRNQTILRCEEAKETLRQNPYGIKALFGGETEYYACRDLLGMSPEGASHFDYILVPHTHIHMRNEVMAEYPEVTEARREIRAKLLQDLPFLSGDQADKMVNTLKEADLIPLVPELKTNVMQFVVSAMTDSFLALLENPEFRRIAGQLPVSIAHSFSPCGVPHAEKNSYLRLLDDSILKKCYSGAAALGVFIEINIGAVREVGTDLQDNEMIRLFRIAKDAGCKFTFGTDAHSVSGLGDILFASDIAELLQLTRADIAEFLQDGVE